MLKKYSLRKIGITTLLLLLSFLLYHYPENINQNINDELYPVQVVTITNDYLSMTSIDCPSNTFQDKVLKIVDSFIHDGLVPKGTSLLDYELMDGVLTLNFNKNILHVSSYTEEKMIEAFIFSFTSLDGVEKIHLLVDDEDFLVLPNSKKELPYYLDRTYGINKIYDIYQIGHMNYVTIYFYDAVSNYIPVSYYYTESDDKVTMIIKELKNESFFSGNLSSYLDKEVELMNFELLEDKVVLDFNEFFSRYLADGKVQEEVKYAIGYSILDSLGISDVIFQINSIKIDELILAK